ncbi:MULTISPECIES: gluconate:H+ symporter [Pseudomonas]|uniref:Gluconate transporter n=1 Tax=Pseudomonas yamanorum TaxID=515393 RepID=A0A1H2FZM7_9PSED|nr:MULTISPECIES: gluconate:H+ symporter [Pseudomonas]MDP9059248.1 GntP family permease [Pseudomonadota bacterium]WEL45530.1 gluconate:H+ symporter [Pseudomonas sp. CBSPBW29]WEL66636.1 gluconate:H+ symporter [Pseudomonas sp. CBSPGW29]WEL70122.1 gluconate:H+ symporter [Pseudomonas sp. CBSPCGW29]WEL77080.1 gluconate:H+ symporter [Pseudomonas sp. CBSPAW29]WEL84314.1 gluconate:H+ symporter [Pseudomonas sp. CBSPCAW29]WEL87144.1 gluconate:H+ symporter [Pseudomonas sp. CBSPCBW29]
MELSTAAWMVHDTRLMFCVLLAIASIIVLISATKLPPFLSILIGTFIAGVGAGLPPEEVAKAFSKGAGAILGEAGIIIALGSMLGALMAESGAADRIATTLLGLGKGKSLPWVMALVAMVIGLPLFFEVGLVMMVPIIFVMAKRSNQPLLKIAIPALAGMTTLHALMPPHPGPLIAVGALHADLGLTMLLGFCLAVPAVILAGPLYGNWLSKRMHVDEPADIGALFSAPPKAPRQPSFGVSLLIILLPVILMLGSTLAKVAMSPESPVALTLKFLGEPLIALGLAVIAAVICLGWASGMPRADVGNTLRKALAPIAVLLLTIGAGGGLKQTLLDAGVSQTISKVAEGAHMPYLLLAWLIAVALRQATGSATVATTTTAGILAPMMAGLAATQSSLVALAIGAGSVFFCHVNDAGFWMVREYFGLQLKQTIWVWSVLQTIVSVVGLVGTLLMWHFLT